MNGIEGLAIKDIIAMSPNTMLVIGILYLLNKYLPPWIEDQKSMNASVRNFVDQKVPEIIASMRSSHEAGVSKIVGEIGTSKTEIKDHVTTQVTGLRDVIHDRRVEQIDAKIERIAGRSNPDLSGATDRQSKI